VLGPLELVGGKAALPVGGAKLRAVLALLAVHVGEAVSEDRLIEVLWGDAAPRTAMKTLRSYISRLRGLLADAEDRLVVETTPGGYRLRAAADVLDVVRVEALAQQAREAVARGDHPWAAVALSEALRTWRGVPLEEFAGEPWAVAESVRLAELREVLVEERVDAELACGRHAALVPELESLVAQHPLRERLWAQRIVALYRSGRQADALRVFQELRSLLAEELGIEPSHELRRLELQVLEQDHALDWTPGEPLAGASPRSSVPTGVVTFVLTDVEGSTARWEQDAGTMAAALADHESAVREAVEANGGAVIKARGEGDSTFSVFWTAHAAATAAIAIQSALADAAGVRVRIGIHTGEAEERDGDYFGPTVNRAARLRDAANAGQTVCSSVTGQLLLEAVRPIEVIDLGEHRLRDIGRADRIHQIGSGTFPPLRGTETSRNNLPAQATLFIGRSADVEAITDLLERHPLVVLTGVGGVGKTRLALEAAASVLDRMADGVFFVDLAPVSDGDLVAPTVASALSLPSSRDSATDVAGFLAQRHALVVLDNCEHLIDACATVLSELLARGIKGRVLATTREAFGLEGERVWQVPSLDDDESRHLFVTRASAVRNSFAMDDSTVSAVDEICHRLDGIPLAIELAAARVAHLSPQQIAERLGDRFSLLTGGRGRVQRQHTLQAALDWSHDLLEPAEQTLLRRLGVFNGTFTLDAVEGICADDQLDTVSILDVLGALVDKSLVVARDGRYRLLETVRLYTEQRLAAASESETFRNRHLRWYLEWTESLVAEATGATAAARRMELDLGNVSVAVSWALAQHHREAAARLAVATAPMWFYSSHSYEAAAWLRPVLDDAAGLPPDLRAACFACLSHVGMMMLTGDVFALARSAVRVEGATPTGPLALAWGILASVSAIRGTMRDDDVAEGLDSAACEVRSLTVRQDFWRAEALNLCAEGYLVVGRFDDAVQFATESVECAIEAEFAQVEWNSRSILLVAWHLLGEH
jgi:predicted ATPase/DNA-binding SARP family transcriptional activator